MNCSFCDKTRWEVKFLIQGPAVQICDECIGLCNDIIGGHFSEVGEFIGWAEGQDDLT